MNPPPTQEPKGTRAWRATGAGGSGIFWATSEGKARYKAVLAIGDVHSGITFADVHVARAEEYDGLEDDYEDGTSEDYITIPNPTTMREHYFYHNGKEYGANYSWTPEEELDDPEEDGLELHGIWEVSGRPSEERHYSPSENPREYDKLSDAFYDNPPPKP